MVTEIKKITLEDYLKELSTSEIDEMYEEVRDINPNLKKNASKEEKIDRIIEKILASFLIEGLGFTDQEMKQLNDIMAGKIIDDVNEKFINEYFVLQDGNYYIIPEEIKEMYNHMLDENCQKEKYLFMISFYMEINGILKVDKLKELLKESGHPISKEKLLEYLKEKDFIIKKNVIYLNESAETLDKEYGLQQLKEEKEYAIYSTEEALAILALREHLDFQKQITKKLSKTVKNKRKLKELSSMICNIIIVGYNYEENIKKLLEKEKIELTVKEEIDLEDLMDEIFWYIPTWINNGYSYNQISEDEYEDDESLDFNNLSDQEKLLIYIHSYLSINGVLEIELLRNVLKEEHHISVAEKEIKNYLKGEDDLIIKGEYVCIKGLETEEIEPLIKIKSMQSSYKIIEDMNKFLKETLEVEVEIEEILEDYDLEEETVDTIISLMRYGGITEELLSVILEEFQVKISEKKQKQLFKNLKNASKNLRIWGLNGYTRQELTDNHKREKIGRNEPCPCGSRKKYKQCCGK
ncbi:MAG: SEC-C domain-containing protein [Erysipelotrichaceae bacterium]|nr:SEC-C domain-containing protein [Erysipelotrichaceae bacterium]